MSSSRPLVRSSGCAQCSINYIHLRPAPSLLAVHTNKPSQTWGHKNSSRGVRRDVAQLRRRGRVDRLWRWVDLFPLSILSSFEFGDSGAIGQVRLRAGSTIRCAAGPMVGLALPPRPLATLTRHDPVPQRLHRLVTASGRYQYVGTAFSRIEVDLLDDVPVSHDHRRCGRWAKGPTGCWF